MSSRGIGHAEGPRLYLRDMTSSEMTLIPGSEDAQAPFFSPDGQSVAFVSSGPAPPADSVGNELGGVWGEDTLWAVDVENSPSFRLGKSHLLYQGQSWNEAAGPNYALSPDGKRFVVVERGKDSAETDVNVVLNWQEELLRLAGPVNR